MNTSEVITQNYIQSIKNLGLKKGLPRQNGLSCFSKWGIPTTKWEEWRYTSLKDLLPNPLLHSPAELPPQSQLEGQIRPFLEQDFRVVFINGQFCQEMSHLPNDVILKIESSSSIFPIMQRDSFEALNRAVSNSVVTLTVPPNTVVSGPIFILHMATENASNHMLSPCLEIFVKDFAKASFFEGFFSEPSMPSYQNIALSCVRSSQGSNTNYIKLNMDSANAIHIGKFKCLLEKDSFLRHLTFSLRGQLVRNNLEIELNQTGAMAEVHGLLAAKDKEHHDLFSTIQHKACETTSNQLCKGVLNDEGRGVFTGKVFVDKDCPGVNAQQLNKNILLSSKAHMDTRPQLEIYTDDVKCSHGATVGQISADEIFYLKSRGISEERAYKILRRAFAAEIVEQIEDEFIFKMISSEVMS